MIMKLTRARLVAVPCDAPSARACPHADEGRDTKAGGAGLPEIHIIYSTLGLIKTNIGGASPSVNVHKTLVQAS